MSDSEEREWPKCPDCGEPHEPRGEYDTRDSWAMVNDESLPKAVRRQLLFSAVAVDSLTTALNESYDRFDDLKRLVGCIIHVNGGAVTIPENVIVAAPRPDDIEVMRFEPVDKPGPVWKINPAVWADVPAVKKAGE